jgi:hypothetical protein
MWAAAQAKGYERGEWATYQQWQERGAQVQKGERATLVVFLAQRVDAPVGSSPTVPPRRTTAMIRPSQDHGCCSHAATAYSMLRRWMATRRSPMLMHQSSSASKRLSSSFHASMPASFIWAIVRSTRPAMTRSPYRRSVRSSLRRITTQHGHTRAGTGRRTHPAVIVS